MSVSRAWLLVLSVMLAACEASPVDEPDAKAPLPREPDADTPDAATPDADGSDGGTSEDGAVADDDAGGPGCNAGHAGFPQCAPCPAGTYCPGEREPARDCDTGTWDHDQRADTACEPQRTCAVSEYESVQGTTTTDRECRALRECGTDQYEASPPSATSDRVCEPVTVCLPGSAQTAAPTPTSDRTCEPCRIGQYCAGSAARPVRCDWRDEDHDPTTPCDEVVQVLAGSLNTCALESSGQVTCWGSNASQESTVPADVTDAVAISTNRRGVTTCAVRSGGQLACWGTTFSVGPFVPASLQAVREVSVGETAACALESTGSVRCWNWLERRGEITVPAGLGEVVQVVTGGGFYCALNAADSYTCWGVAPRAPAAPRLPVPMSGLGIRRLRVYSVSLCTIDTAGTLSCYGDMPPVPESLRMGVRDVDPGPDPCLVTEAGSLHCWNDSGEVDIPDALRSQQVLQVSSGGEHRCAIGDDGLTCWPSPANLGQAFIPVPFPVMTQISAATFGNIYTGLEPSGALFRWPRVSYAGEPPADLRATLVSAGEGHSCAIDMAGSLQCWGSNYWGQATVPPLLGPVKHVAVGDTHTCAVDTAGLVQCWGQNVIEGTDVPVDVRDVAQVAAGYTHSCALHVDGRVSCWGAPNGHGSGQSEVPTTLEPAKQLVVGTDFTCALELDGEVVCWGAMYRTEEMTQPMLGPVKTLAAGKYHVCALQDSGEIQCWGRDVQSPTLSLQNVASLSCGDGHCCALSELGQVECWGPNNDLMQQAVY